MGLAARSSPGHSDPTGGTPHSDEEHHCLSGRVGREEVSHIIVEERKPCSATPEGVRRQVDLAAEDSTFELGRSVSPVSEPVHHAMLVSQIIEIDAGVRR